MADKLSDLEKALEVIDRMEMRGVEMRGGYPMPIVNFPPGWVTWVCEEDGEVDVKFYRETTVEKWYRRARRVMREHEDLDIGEAMYETMPAGDHE